MIQHFPRFAKELPIDSGPALYRVWCECGWPGGGPAVVIGEDSVKVALNRHLLQSYPFYLDCRNGGLFCAGNRDTAYWCAYHEELVSAEHWFNCSYTRPSENDYAYAGNLLPFAQPEVALTMWRWADLPPHCDGLYATPRHVALRRSEAERLYRQITRRV